jgi:hypothetical protein
MTTPTRQAQAPDGRSPAYLKGDLIAVDTL